MTISKELETEICRLHYAEHWPKGTISSQLNLHEDVINRVIHQSAETKKPTQRANRKHIKPYHDFIMEQLTRYPGLRATRIFDMISERGYLGSIRTVRSYIQNIRPMSQSEAYLQLSPLIGEQAQIDWAHVGKIPVIGGTRRLYLFVYVLSYSRGLWGEFVMDLSVHSLLRSLVRAATYFQGVPRQWLFDNAKTVVLERYGEAIRFHPLLLDLAKTYRVQCRACRPRKPQHKGRVERVIRFLRDRFLAGRTIYNAEQGNEELLAFIKKIADTRLHPEWKPQTVLEVLNDERQHLLPLPEHTPATDQIITTTVKKRSLVHFDRNTYSVPPQAVEKSVTLVADDKHVRILDGTECIAHHRRYYDCKRKIEASEHRKELIAHKRRAYETTGKNRLQTAAPHIDILFKRWVEGGRNVGFMTIQILRF